MILYTYILCSIHRSWLKIPLALGRVFYHNVGMPQVSENRIILTFSCPPTWQDANLTAGHKTLISERVLPHPLEEEML